MTESLNQVHCRAVELLETTCADNVEIFCFWIDDDEFRVLLAKYSMESLDDIDPNKDFTKEEKASLLFEPDEMLDIVWKKVQECDDIDVLKDFCKKFADPIY